MKAVGAGWYNELIEDCRDILVEHSFTARWALIEGHHKLGERILEEHRNFEKQKVYGEEITKRISLSLGRSQRSIQLCVQFAKKFPDLNRLPEGKNTMWHDIVHKYLPQPKEDKPEPKGDLLTCPNCGFKFKKDKKC